MNNSNTSSANLIQGVLRTNRYYLLPLLFSALTVIVIISLFGIFYNQLPNNLPLFYSLPWGSSQLVSKQQFLILPAIITLLSLLNTFIAWHIHPTQQVLKRMLTITLIILCLISLITTFKIFFIFI